MKQSKSIYSTDEEILEAFQISLRHHQSGQLTEAKAIYQQILVVSPDRPDVLHMLGLIAYQEGRHQTAIELIKRSIQFAPNYPEAYYNLGIAQQEQDLLDDAATSYQNAILLKSDYSEAHNNLGQVYRFQGKLEEAIACYNNAIYFRPEDAEAYNNLGKVFLNQSKLTEAFSCFKQAVSLKPNHADAFFNLGSVLQEKGHVAEAISCYETSISLKPEDARVHQRLGIALKRQGDLAKAVASFERAVALRPGDASIHRNLGHAQNLQNKVAEAVKSYQHSLALDPGNGEALHFLAALTGSESVTAPNDYIEKLFDGYANIFDKHLLHSLGYQSPAILVDLIRKTPPATQKWDVLDLGCGTGLFGVEIIPYSARLVGVDLSANMLDKARERKIYAHLERSELLEMMKSETSSSYDVVAAADVFVYIGKLDEIFEETARLLRPDGVFAFSVEAIEQSHKNAEEEKLSKYILNASGRYAHSANYIRELAHNNCISVKNLVFHCARQDHGKEIYNWYVILKKSAHS